MSPIELHFVKPLAEFYGRNPFGPGFAKRLEPYGQTLNAEVLSSVANRLMERSKTFPNFQACQKALAHSEEAINNPPTTEDKPWDTQARDKAAWMKRQDALKLCRCRLGEQADREGWLAALIDFCAERGRLPGDHEIGRVIAVARKSEEGVRACQSSPFYRSLVKMRETMLEKAYQDVFEAERPAAPREERIATLPVQMGVTTQEQVERRAAVARLRELGEGSPVVIGEGLSRYLGGMTAEAAE